jgi:AraC-like DNA-binding protein
MSLFGSMPARCASNLWQSGGLAAWQQRVVTAYIEEDLAEQISLATLARLVGWSRCHRGLPQTTTNPD